MNNNDLITKRISLLELHSIYYYFWNSKKTLWLLIKKFPEIWHLLRILIEH